MVTKGNKYFPPSPGFVFMGLASGQILATTPTC